MEKILTLHPDPEKQGVNIDRKKYDIIHDALIAVLKKQGPTKLMELFAILNEELPDFDGSPTWYGETVKLDLEARGIITHDRKTRQVSIK